jgi:hypothetical protein
MAFCSIMATSILIIAKKKTVQPASIQLVEEEEIEMINTL